MKGWAPIEYREFYDIPRILLTEAEGRVFLFDCPFNESKDEYEATYKIHLMPEVGGKELEGSWQCLPAKAARLVGEVQTSEVEFDATLRQQVNLEVLTRFGF